MARNYLQSRALHYMALAGSLHEIFALTTLTQMCLRWTAEAKALDESPPTHKGQLSVQHTIVTWQ